MWAAQIEFNELLETNFIKQTKRGRTLSLGVRNARVDPGGVKGSECDQNNNDALNSGNLEELIKNNFLKRRLLLAHLSL